MTVQSSSSGQDTVATPRLCYLTWRAPSGFWIRRVACSWPTHALTVDTPPERSAKTKAGESATHARRTAA